MNIPFKSLNSRLINEKDKCKTTKAYENNVVSYSFLGILSKMISKFENYTEYEVGLFVQSFDKWLDRKDVNNTAENKCDPQPGDICMTDWNINYSPELSYKHPCVIVKNINDLIAVLPVSSQSDIIKLAYHPIDNPDGDIWHRKVTTSDGFKKESVIFLDGLKVISKSRIINKMSSLNCDLGDKNSLFSEICLNLCSMYFGEEMNMFNKELEIKLEAKFNKVLKEKESKIVEIENFRRLQQSRADKYRTSNIELKAENKKLKMRLTN